MIRCRECEKLVNWLTQGHLRTHGLTKATYLEKYPGAPTMSRAFREQQSARRRKDWVQDPDRTKAQSAAGRKRWSSTKFRKKMAKAQARAATPEFRERMSEVVADTWKNPETRRNRIDGLRRVYASPELRDRQRQKSEENWKDPEYRAKVLPGLRRGQQSEKRKQAVREAIKRNWADPEFRKRMSETSRAQWTPEKRAARSEELRRQWAEDPEYRERMAHIEGQGRGKGGVLEGTDIWMRSTWERNYARILNARGRKWRYESTRFRLSTGSTYTPDFRVGKLRYVELKGYKGEAWTAKLDLFRTEYPEISLFIVDEEKYYSLTIKWRHLPNWEESK